MSASTITLPTTKVPGSLVGIDGNAFSLMGYFTRQARRAGWSQAQIDVVITEARSGDYAHLITTLDSYLEYNQD